MTVGHQSGQSSFGGGQARGAVGPPGRLVARILLIATLVLFVGQVVVKEVFSEPYPGLFQPGFGAPASDGRFITVDQPVVVATFADGTTSTFDHRVVVADSRVLKLAVFNRGFGQEAMAEPDAETVGWLSDRLSELSGGPPPLRARIDWVRVTYDMENKMTPSEESLWSTEFGMDA